MTIPKDTGHVSIKNSKLKNRNMLANANEKDVTHPKHSQSSKGINALKPDLLVVMWL